MATRLSTASIERAIEHISTFGDTDVFPHPIETAFLIERKKEIAAELTKIVGANTLGQRQSFLIRGLNDDVNFFRRNKTRFEELNVFEKGHFMLGATCLPRDEFTNWISAVKPNLRRPLDARFCDWLKTKCGALEEIVSVRIRQ